jgi:hypothetical protein
MRKTALALALLTVTSFGFYAQAADDFSALLADLSFSDLPATKEPLAVVDAEPAKELKPAPQLTMPGKLEAPIVAAAPKVALQDPIPATTPTAIDTTVDLESAFDLEESSIPAQSVGHVFHHNQPQDCNCNQENVIICSSHVKPSLPTSTLMQYFRTNKCNTHVWDGYSQPCRSANEHVLGQCDCFEDKHGCFGGACSNGNCGKCGHGRDRSDCASCADGCDN